MRNKRTIQLFVLGIAMLGLLSGCASNQTAVTPEAVALAAVSPGPPGPYFIQSGDQLDIKFFYNPEINETIIVRPDGKISLQLVDEVQAAGLEPSQLDEVLTEKYARELKKPVITVIVRSFEGQRIYVGGEVNQQREIKLPAGMTVLQAVFEAGGFKETASPENAVLIRQGANREPVPIQVDLKNAMYGQGEGANLVLKPNDIVYIPKSAIAHANKWVNQYIEKLLLFRGVSVGFTYQTNKFRE